MPKYRGIKETILKPKTFSDRAGTQSDRRRN